MDVSACRETVEGIELSVVVPAFNEESCIDEFYRVVSSQLDQVTSSWEIIFVDDGSRDRTVQRLLAIREKDSRVKILCFARNFGNQIATSAGLRFSEGEAVITMDADLQHPPEMIAEMVQLWKEGYHSVYTVRSYGKKTGFFKRKLSSLFAKTLNRFSDLSMPEGISDFRLLDRRIADYVNSMEENSRFLRAMISWLGFREIGIPYVANPRHQGETKFSLTKLIRLSVDGITSFSIRPLRWIIYLGMTVASLSLIYAGYVLYEVFVEGIITPGWPTLIVAVLFLGGVQLISTGVVGEYVGRTFMESKRRPLFVIQEKHGIDSEEKASPLDADFSQPAPISMPRKIRRSA